MTNPPVLNPLSGALQPDQLLPEPSTRTDPPRGFLDCRGEWQDLDDDEDRHAPA